MPARVEFRLGSIFDEPCDLLVIPSSTGGTVTPEIQAEIRKAGLPFPGAMENGISRITLQDARWKAVAYAATVSGQTSSPVKVEEVCPAVGPDGEGAGVQDRFRSAAGRGRRRPGS